jgi:hypothetical protein
MPPADHLTPQLRWRCCALAIIGLILCCPNQTLDQRRIDVTRIEELLQLSLAWRPMLLGASIGADLPGCMLRYSEKRNHS